MKNKLILCTVLAVASVLAFAFKNQTLPQSPLLKDLLLQLSRFNKELPSEKIYLQTDKPFYKPGDDIWIKAYLVNGTDHTPTAISDVLYIELIDPKGSIEKTLSLPVQGGGAAAEFQLDASAPGGLYTLKAYTQWMKNFGEDTFFEKKVQVQKVIMPRVLLKLDFKKEAYGASDRVEADLEVKNLENTPVQNHQANIIVQLNGKELLQTKATTNNEGKCRISFTLPDTLISSDGLLNAVIAYEGKTESISRAIPIVLNKIDLRFFPEGGDLVEHIKSKVAFKALNEFGKPADIEGELRDKTGTIVARFSSYHQGMGAFIFTPKPNQHYSAHITKPKGISVGYSLPDIQAKGYTLAIDTVGTKSIELRINSPVSKEISIVAQVRGQSYFAETIQPKQGENKLSIPLSKVPAGIVQITLFDYNGAPRCERLAFVNAHKQLHVKVSTHKAQYQPREKVELTIQTLDEDSLPVQASLSVAVVDDKVISFADDKQDNILSQLLMSSDLRGNVDEPSFYFKRDEPKAAQALEYVMLTHGWRRFTWKEVTEKKRSVMYQPEQNGFISGTVVDVASGKAVPATITLIELANQARVAKVQTKADGSFAFLDVDPATTVQLIAQVSALSLKSAKLEIRLDEKAKSSYKVIAGNNAPPAWQKRRQIIEVPDEVMADQISFSAAAPMVAMAEVDFTDMEVMPGAVLGMQADVKQLSEVVVVGYGVQERRELSGAVTYIHASDLMATGGEENQLQGRAAGVQITGNTGVASAVRIRGSSSINAGSQPLYIIDGFPVDNEVSNTFSAFSTIHPENIDNIQVLKGAAGTALYGSRASNGVILITTKKGYYTPGRIPKTKQVLQTAVVSPKVFTAVREFYAPVYGPEEQPEVRSDFRSTIYWNPTVVTDQKGKAKVTFYNSDELTSFRVTAEGIAINGLIGRTEKEYFTQLPFTMDVKIPPYLVFEDRVDIPLFIKNNTATLQEAKLRVSLPYNLQLNNPYDSLLTLTPGEAKAIYISSTVLPKAGIGKLEVELRTKEYKDAFSQEVDVQPKGFPMEVSLSDRALARSYTFDINKPMPGSVKAELKAYPDVLSDLMAGMESILREPYGCFEQTSSSTYPNILALQFMQETGTSNKEVEERALDYIHKGYKRLISFETRLGGFEWFGKTPPHEGLTAFGLMEFVEMKKVYQKVDDKLIERTKKWLLSRRDGNGGFVQSKGSFGFSAASAEVTNSYLVFALSEVGVHDLDKEFATVYAEAVKSKDPYRRGLVTLAAFNLNKKAKAEELLHQLIAQVDKQGIENIKAEHSIVRSYGRSLSVETASIITLALLKSETPRIDKLQPMVDYLVKSRQYGGFGSTQGTILALKALTEYARFSNKTSEGGLLAVYHNKKLVGSKQYEPNTKGEILLAGIERHLQEGNQRFDIVFDDTRQALPYSLNVSWSSYTPNSSKECKVGLTTQLAATTTSVGQTVRLSTTLKNRTRSGVPMTVALVGIPSGLSPQPWQLKELQEKGLVDFYEVRNNYVVFYFRELAPLAVHHIYLDLKAEVPGIYEAPASTAYLYYTNEHKDWAGGEHIEITR